MGRTSPRYLNRSSVNQGETYLTTRYRKTISNERHEA
jgi:hypothetical protein